MTEILTKLASIEVSSEVLQEIEVEKIYESFRTNFLKLGDLKKFRDEYEKKSRLMRWWHNDKLRDAQLNSTEVQAEFSKTIGQLMMISVIQSKRLAEQQMYLLAQQGQLKKQSDGIDQNTTLLQMQHARLAEQSTKLETLVHDYFALKGLTEEGAQKLIEIANEVKAAKSSMLDEFSSRSAALERLGDDLKSRIDESEAAQRCERDEFAGQVQRSLESAEQRQSVAVAELHREQKVQSGTLAELGMTIEQSKIDHDQRQSAVDNQLAGLGNQGAELAAAQAATDDLLSKVQSAQESHEQALIEFRQGVSERMKCLNIVSSGLFVAVIAILSGLVYLAKTI